MRVTWGLGVLLAAGLVGRAVALEVSTVDLGLARPAAQPNVVADPARDRFILSWQERDAESCAVLRTAVLPREGALGPARDVARGCDWFVNWADIPSLAIADNGDWWTFHLRKSASSTYAYDIRLQRSQDEGRTWSAPITPHEDGTPTEHGFVSMVPQSGDRMLVVWLDGRRTATGVSAHGHGAHDEGHGPAEGPMTLRSVEIGADFVLRRPHEIDARVCSCCPTDLVRTATGAVAVFRDRSDDEVRDIHHARYADGRWTRGGAVRTDGWRIAACPVNGPALAARGDALVAAWPTMAAGPLQVNVAAVGDSAPARVLDAGEGALGRPDLVPWGERAWLATWLGAGEARGTALRLAVLDAGLQPIATQDVSVLPPGRATGFPKLAALPGQAVLVWTAPDVTAGRVASRATVQVRRLSPTR